MNGMENTIKMWTLVIFSSIYHILLFLNSCLQSCAQYYIKNRLIKKINITMRKWITIKSLDNSFNNSAF